MSKKHLDYDGLLYLWDGIKTYLADYAKYDSNLTISKGYLTLDFANSTIESTSSLHLKGVSIDLTTTSENAYFVLGDDDYIGIYSTVGIDIASGGYVSINGKSVEMFADGRHAGVLCNEDGDTYISGYNVYLSGSVYVNGNAVATQAYVGAYADSMGTAANNYTDSQVSGAKAYADTVGANTLTNANSYTDGVGQTVFENAVDEALSQSKSYTNNQVDSLTAYDTLRSGVYYKTVSGTTNVITNIGSDWTSKYDFLLLNIYLNAARYTAVIEKDCNRATVIMQNPWSTSFQLYYATIVIDTAGDVNFQRCGILSSSTYTEKLSTSGYYLGKIVGVKVK